MTTGPRMVARLSALALGLSAVGAAQALASTPSDLLYERALMVEAGGKCRLFSPEIAAALWAAEAEARGAALRTGASDQSVAAVKDRAVERARAVPCNSPDLSLAAGRVRRAFDGYAQLRTMSFPGSAAIWEADRKPWPAVVDRKVVPGPRWRLEERAGLGGGPLLLGLAEGPELIALATRTDGAVLSGARLSFRDPAKASEPFLDPRRADLAGKIPGASLTQVFFARALSAAPSTLLPPGAGGGVTAVFPARAADALAALDPRESLRLELVYATANGERVDSAYLEVGDFAAARAFLAAGR